MNSDPTGGMPTESRGEVQLPRPALRALGRGYGTRPGRNMKQRTGILCAGESIGSRAVMPRARPRGS